MIRARTESPAGQYRRALLTSTSSTSAACPAESTDGKVELYVETHPIEESESLEQFFNEKLAGRVSGGDHIEYSLRKDNWYVISGVNTKGFEFYEKFYRFSDPDGGSWYIYFDFVYPHSEHAKYDPMVATIAKGFNPRLPGHNYEH